MTTAPPAIEPCEICGRKRRKERTANSGNGPVQACARCAQKLEAVTGACSSSAAERRKWLRFDPDLPKPPSIAAAELPEGQKTLT